MISGTDAHGTPVTVRADQEGTTPAVVAQRYHVSQPSWLIDKALKLGLDLKGGVHLVLQVQTDDALRLETQLETARAYAAVVVLSLFAISLYGLLALAEHRLLPWTNRQRGGPTP